MGSPWEQMRGDGAQKVREQLYDKFRASIVDRAFDRINAGGLPVAISVPGSEAPTWKLPGLPKFGDEKPEYFVSFANGKYACSCYKSLWGETRQSRICSHVLAVIIERRLNPAHSKYVPAADDPEDSEEEEPSDFPSPASLLLPNKFRRFRSHQIEALKRILASDKKYLFVQAPTGSGKSLIAAAVQRMTGKKMLYTCHTKTLQDQFVADFAKTSDNRAFAVELKGRENYPTAQYAHQFPNINCGLCSKTKGLPACQWCCPPHCYKSRSESHCEGCKEPWLCCPYHRQKRAALAAPLAVLNMAMFLGEANFAGEFGKACNNSDRKGPFPWAVLDEGDKTEEALMSFVELEISPKMIAKLQIPGPQYKTKPESWVEWCEKVAIPKCEAEMLKLNEKRDDKWKLATVEDIRHGNQLERLLQKLGFFAKAASSGRWVNCTDSEQHEIGPWIFKPIWVSDFAQGLLWSHASRWIIMSATIISMEQMCWNLKVPPEESEFIDMPSTFPVENRRVFALNVPKVNHKTKDVDWPRLVGIMDTLLDSHMGDKCLVHTVSYALTMYVMEHSRHKPRLVSYRTAKEREAVLQRFKDSTLPYVLVAPSMERGIDLPDDLCRCIIVLKVPYPSLGDKQVAARLYGSRDGQSWYRTLTIRSLVQMTGRGVRHEHDHCTSYIADGEFARLYAEARRVLPSWWKEAVMFINLPK